MGRAVTLAAVPAGVRRSRRWLRMPGWSTACSALEPVAVSTPVLLATARELEIQARRLSAVWPGLLTELSDRAVATELGATSLSMLLVQLLLTVPRGKRRPGCTRPGCTRPGRWVRAGP
ncbi:MAG: hypothetical protein JO147_13190 [Actinobacteria bacterium]|nr:hypothetical protein [Actinomycetota bacterium]